MVRRPEIDPPQAGRDHERENGYGHQLTQFLGLMQGFDNRIRGSGQGFSEHDQGEEAVPFGDVVRMPRRASDSFGHDRNRNLDEHQKHEADDLGRRRGNHQPGDPENLGEEDPEGEINAARPAWPPDLAARNH